MKPLCDDCPFFKKYEYPIQRPLKTIAIKSGDVYIPRGVSVPALDKDIPWEFQPKKLGTYGALHFSILPNYACKKDLYALCICNCR